MKKTYIIILFFCVSILYGCAGIPKEIKKAFTNCYNEEDTGIDSLININGYYSELYLCDEGRRKSYTNLVFYLNGIVNTSMRVFDEQQNIHDKETWDLELALSRISSGENKKESKWFYRGYWGRYIVEADTIKIQHIYKPGQWSLNDGYTGRETWYKVIDRNTIELIKSSQLTTNKTELKRSKIIPKVKSNCERIIATFKPSENIPSHEGAWILKEKWFWCNEADWEALKNTEK